MESIKEFILWAKSHYIHHMQVGDVEVTFSPLAFVPEDLKGAEPQAKNEQPPESTPEDILFWSSR